MTVSVLQEIDLLELRGAIKYVTARELNSFRRWADMQIVSSLHGLVAPSEAREAAAELARDCGALADDLALAGGKPSRAWDDVIHDDRLRALVSLERLVAIFPHCDRFDPKTKAYRLRPGSVPMRRKAWR
jgi:hypothetical protein